VIRGGESVDVVEANREPCRQEKQGDAKHPSAPTTPKLKQTQYHRGSVDSQQQQKNKERLSLSSILSPNEEKANKVLNSHQSILSYLKLKVVLL